MLLFGSITKTALCAADLPHLMTLDISTPLQALASGFQVPALLLKFPEFPLQCAVMTVALSFFLWTDGSGTV